MADNCHMLEEWPFHAAFPDGCCISDAITHETDTLIRALQLSLSADRPDTDVLPAFAAAGCFPFLPKLEPAASSSASEARTRHHPPPLQPPPATGKISKRKSRVSRRPATTFIAADPANFLRMVQQVTGARPDPAAAAAAVRPEPRRKPGLLVDCLPTLDTSALLLGSVGGGAASAGGSSGSPSLGSHTDVTFRAAGFDAELPPPCFPTLESWGAM